MLQLQFFIFGLTYKSYEFNKPYVCSYIKFIEIAIELILLTYMVKKINYFSNFSVLFTGVTSIDTVLPKTNALLS